MCEINEKLTQNQPEPHSVDEKSLLNLLQCLEDLIDSGIEGSLDDAARCILASDELIELDRTDRLNLLDSYADAVLFFKDLHRFRPLIVSLISAKKIM